MHLKNACSIPAVFTVVNDCMLMLVIAWQFSNVYDIPDTVVNNGILTDVNVVQSLNVYDIAVPDMVVNAGNDSVVNAVHPSNVYHIGSVPLTVVNEDRFILAKDVQFLNALLNAELPVMLVTPDMSMLVNCVHPEHMFDRQLSDDRVVNADMSILVIFEFANADVKEFIETVVNEDRSTPPVNPVQYANV